MPTSAIAATSLPIRVADKTASHAASQSALPVHSRGGRKEAACNRLPQRVSQWRRSHYKGRQCGCQAAEVDTDTSTTLRLSLDAEEIAANVTFGRAQLGKDFAIVVSKVAKGTVAEKESLARGQKLLAISSPMQSGRNDEMWRMDERPSLRFVQDAIRMRRTSSITLEVTRNSILGAADTISENSQTSLMQSMEDAALQEQTIADKLSEAFKENEDTASREKAQRQRRIQRRKDYIDREASRNNTPFVLGMLAALLLPSAGILAYAFSSGLMDRIGNSYRPY